MKYYHKNNLNFTNRKAYFDDFYNLNYRVHATLNDKYDTSMVVAALGETLAWLEATAEEENIPNASVDQLFYYVVDASMFIAYGINVSSIDIDNYISIIDMRIPILSYNIEHHHEDNEAKIIECFSHICIHLSNFSHLQMVSCIAFIITDFLNATISVKGRNIEALHILLDVLATVKYIANKASLERKSEHDLSVLFGGTGQKNSNFNGYIF